MDDGVRFKSRVAALRNRGFDVEAPTGDLASVEMLRLEELADRASEIRSKVLDLPEHREDDRRRLLAQLSNPMEAASVEIEISGLLRRHRPWVIIAERSRIKWSDEGRSVELSHIIERLDAIDDAIVLGSPRILSMIEEAVPSREIDVVIEEIERRQERRFQALQGMVDMFKERGWDCAGIQTGPMHEQFSKAEKIQALDSKLTLCQRKIENEIRPFSEDISERFRASVSLAQKEATDESMSQIKTEIDACAQDLSRRLSIVENRIEMWQSDGFSIPVELPLLAREMASWEERLPIIEAQIQAMRQIWVQMEPHLHQWPEYRSLAERTLGHLGTIDSLEVLLQGLVSKTSAAKDACEARLESWAAHGIETSTWSPLVDTEPRAILEELDSHQPFIDVIIPLIEGLQLMDTSVNGGPEVEHWLKGLRSSMAGLDIVESAQDWFDLAVKRRARHRAFLDQARDDLATLWPEEIDSNSLDLATYEATVSGLESGEGVSFSTNSQRTHIEASGRLNQVILGLESELDDWRHLGWSVGGLRELLSKDPVRLGLDLPEIRNAMANHDVRLARLEPLPWALDVELAERVLADLMRPEKLAELDDEYQDLMLVLANAEGRGDPGFEFKPFRPQSPIARIQNKLPVLIPIVEEDIQPEEPPEVISEIIDQIIEGQEEIGDLAIEEEIVTEIRVPEMEPRGIRELFGLGDHDVRLSELLKPPLDVRVQRLARIASLLERGGTKDHHVLQERLPRIAKKLEEWTAERLSRRHASSGNGLLVDARELGSRLADIPGPGAVMPLVEDVFTLPEPTDLDGLSAAIRRLEKSVMLPSATMKISEPVES